MGKSAVLIAAVTWNWAVYSTGTDDFRNLKIVDSDQRNENEKMAIGFIDVN